MNNRLKYLRKEKDLTQQKLSELIGLPKSTYVHYELGKREPDQATLILIADFYDVSIDYLLGHSDIRNFKVDSSASNISNESTKSNLDDFKADSLSFSADRKLTTEEYEDIQQYINFKVSQNNKK